MEVEDLITDMQAVKQQHPTLTIQDVLRVFNIQALIELRQQIARSSK